MWLQAKADLRNTPKSHQTSDSDANLATEQALKRSALSLWQGPHICRLIFGELSYLLVELGGLHMALIRLSTLYFREDKATLEGLNQPFSWGCTLYRSVLICSDNLVSNLPIAPSPRGLKSCFASQLSLPPVDAIIDLAGFCVPMMTRYCSSSPSADPQRKLYPTRLLSLILYFLSSEPTILEQGVLSATKAFVYP